MVCPGGKVQGLMCYKLYKGALSWTQAESNCESNGGHLATVNNKATQDILVTYMDEESETDVWLGGEEQADSWSWITGKTDVWLEERSRQTAGHGLQVRQTCGWEERSRQTAGHGLQVRQTCGWRRGAGRQLVMDYR